MSKISALGNNEENLPKILQQYEGDLASADQHLSIKGKFLEQANKENPSWQVYYDQRRVELHTILKYLDAKVQSVRGKLFRSYTESHQRELSDRAKDKYIDNEEKYLTRLHLYLEVKEVYDKYESIVNGFTARGYALNNITRARVANVHNTEL